MAEVYIDSDNASFEEKPFFISQAQRFFVNFLLSYQDELPSWIFDYAEDLSFDSWNNEFKSFFLKAEDGYFDCDSKNRKEVFLGFIRKAIACIKNIDYYSFQERIMDFNVFDKKDSSITKESLRIQFLPDTSVENNSEALSRICGVLENVSRILQV